MPIDNNRQIKRIRTNSYGWKWPESTNFFCKYLITSWQRQIKGKLDHVEVQIDACRIGLCLKRKYRPHVKRVTANASFHKRSPEWRVLKTLASRLPVAGRNRTFSNGWWCHTLLTLRTLCEGCYLISIGRAKRFKDTTCGRVYFWKRRRTSPPNPDTCGRGLNLSVSRRTVRYAKIPWASPYSRKSGRMCALTYRKLRPLLLRDLH